MYRVGLARITRAAARACAACVRVRVCLAARRQANNAFGPSRAAQTRTACSQGGRSGRAVWRAARGGPRGGGHKLQGRGAGGRPPRGRAGGCYPGPSPHARRRQRRRRHNGAAEEKRGAQQGQRGFEFLGGSSCGVVWCGVVWCVCARKMGLKAAQQQEKGGGQIVWALIGAGGAANRQMRPVRAPRARARAGGGGGKEKKGERERTCCFAVVCSSKGARGRGRRRLFCVEHALGGASNIKERRERRPLAPRRERRTNGGTTTAGWRKREGGVDAHAHANH